MAILLNEHSRIVVQGITGGEGGFHTREMVKFGSTVVAGVTPGKGGMDVDGIPVYDSVIEAVQKQGANASAIFVPASFAADAIIEAIDAGVGLIVCMSEGIPVLELVKIKKLLKESKSRLIGPNCPGLTSPGIGKIGFMPNFIHKKGGVGVVSRSGTLTYEVISQLTDLGLGQSTSIGIGGDPIIGTTFTDALELFQNDRETKLVMIIGEIGGNAEEEAAEFVKNKMDKPVIGFIAGQTAPPGKRMGHAGAIISGGKGTAAEKISAWKQAGIEVVENLAEMGVRAARVLKKM
ncbi:MAG: succinate--CoA ligase subunit alpha [Spirochaetes bacterium RBG_16_49_21]|nr:MAG: succinate--CoA ligase subunit alpha [Spirochaetes bacterium RBG_16_49_21]